MLENSAAAIKNGQSRETGKKGHTRRRQTKGKYNTIYLRRKQTHITLFQRRSH